MRRSATLLAFLLVVPRSSRAEDPAPAKPELQIPAPESMVPESLPLQHDCPIAAVAWSPDSTSLAACDEQGNIIVWRATGGKRLGWKDAQLPWGASLRTIAWSPDGALIATGGEAYVAVWDAETGKLRRSIPCRQRIGSVAFLPDSRRLVIAGMAGELNIADVAGAAGTLELPSPAQKIEMVVVSPDGKKIAVAGQAPQIAVVDLPGGEVRMRFGEAASLAANWVSWGPAQFTLITAPPDFGLLELKAASGMQADGRASGPERDDAAGEYRPDVEALFGMTGEGRAFRRRLAMSNYQWSLDLSMSSRPFVVVSPDGQRVAFPDGDRTLAIVGAASGKILAGGLRTRPQHVAWSGDGSAVFATKGTSEVHAFDSRTGKRLRGYIAPGNRILGLASRDDGALVAATYGGAWLRVTDLTNSHDALRVPCKEPPDWSALSCDGSTFAWRTSDEGVRVLDVPGSAELPGHMWGTKPEDGFESLSPRGDVLLRADLRSKYLVFYDTSTGHEVQRSRIPISEFHGATLSADGALTAFWTKTYWSEFVVAATGRGYSLPIDISSFEDRNHWITCAFSPDSRRFAVLFQQALAIFDAVSQKSVASFPLTDTGGAFAWSPDSSRVATLSADGITRIWHLPDFERPSQPKSNPLHDWGDMACLRLDRALSAAARLEAAGPEAVALLRAKFAEKESPAHLADLLKQMGDPDQATHNAAVEELTWLGVQAETAIAAEMARVEPGAYRDKLEALLRQAESHFGPSAHNLQRIRGMEVLEGIATAESLDALRHISAESPSPRERADADAAIRRIQLKAAR